MTEDHGQRVVRAALSRRELLAAGAGSALAALAGGRAGLLRPAAAAATPGAGSVVLAWNDAALAAVRQSRLGPPMVARALAIVHTAVYDAWAAYDAVAVGTHWPAPLRRPPAERTLAARNAAISFAAYRAAADLFPASRPSLDALMAALGLDPADTSPTTDTPSGVGNLAAQAVLAFRHRDGANQLGDEPGGVPGVAYSDYTGYAPVNAPMDLRAPFDPASVTDVDRWQPLTYLDAAGNAVTPRFVGPQFDRVAPYALTSPSQWRSADGPYRSGDPEFTTQARDLLAISAGLTDREKTIAEYWADGPSSELPPGHWHLFAQYVSRRDGHDLDRDVKLFYALGNAIMDAGIAAWDNKRHFDSVRPITAIRSHLLGQLGEAWAGPFQGTRTIPCEQWLPYQRATFPTPPFAEFSSGHSSFSAAGAEILRRFTHSHAFGASATIPAGSSLVEPGAVPAEDLTLSWRTFREAADEAGISRRYGGIHFEAADLYARRTGRHVAAQAWHRAQRLFSGHL